MWGRASASDDLKEYREDYPSRPALTRCQQEEEERECNKNVLFYQNKIKMQPERVKVDDVIKLWWGDYSHLESSHSFVQWLFPIQEHGMNYQAQPLMKHERSVMRSDPNVLRRAVHCFRLMLDFYGFELLVAASNRDSNNDGDAALPSATPFSSSAASNQMAAGAGNTTNEMKARVDTDPLADVSGMVSPAESMSDMEDADSTAAGSSSSSLSSAIREITHPTQIRIRRLPDGKYEEQFHNLNHSGHNYLRITRILKFLGEMGLEAYKIAFLDALKHEIYITRKLFKKQRQNAGPSSFFGFGYGLTNGVRRAYENYWSLTIYDDATRQAVQEEAERLGAACDADDNNDVAKSDSNSRSNNSDRSGRRNGKEGPQDGSCGLFCV